METAQSFWTYLFWRTLSDLYSAYGWGPPVVTAVLLWGFTRYRSGGWLAVVTPSSGWSQFWKDSMLATLIGGFVLVGTIIVYALRAASVRDLYLVDENKRLTKLTTDQGLEVARQNDVEQQLGEMKKLVTALQNENRILREQTDDRAVRQRLATDLVGLHTAAAPLLEKAFTAITQEDLEAEYGSWATKVVGVLERAGRKADAAYFASNSVPEGFPVPDRLSIPRGMSGEKFNAYRWLTMKQFKLERILRDVG